MRVWKKIPNCWRCDFFNSAQTAAVTRQNACVYDEGASGSIIYAYVNGNPLSFIDPKGLAGLRLPGFPLPIVPPANPGVGSPGGGGTGNPDLDAGGGYYYKKPSWPSWPPGGDVPRDDPWPKDDKNFCIRTYANCENYNWTGSCQACLDLCKGSDSGDWPFHMCKPRNKNQCE